MYILGDIGNTDIKICVYNTKFKLLKKKIFQNRLNNDINLNKNLSFIVKNKKKIKKILFSSVTPVSFLKIKKFFFKNTKIKTVEVKDIKFSNLINIKINQKQVGSDRIANAIAIKDDKNNYIVVDLGTATTFDIIKKKDYLGGVIAPGLKLSLETLSKKASLIPKIKY